MAPTVKRVYVGSHAAVDVMLPDGESVTVNKNEAADFPADMAGDLDASDAWAQPGQRKKEA